MIFKKLTTKLTSMLLVLIMMMSIINVNVLAAKTPEGATSNGKKYIVNFKNENGKDKLIKDSVKGKKVKTNFKKQNSLSINLTDSEAADLAISADVEFIEPDSSVEILSIGKADKKDKKVKNKQKNQQDIPWGIECIGADQTLEKYDGKKVKVAVLDTGISNHEDIDIKKGVSFVDYTTSYADDNGHGTHVTGTIAASNNKIGVVGVAPNAEIFALKVLDQNGSGNYSNIISAIEWAIDNKIEVINMSFGGSEDSKALHEAIQLATNAGIAIVAASGNRGAGIDTMTYPAKYSEVISVGAIDENFKVASFSSRGDELDIVAPGTSIISTANDGEYAAMTGTSMAAPHVTGAIAALKGKNSKMSVSELTNKIYETATPIGVQASYGHGLLNIARATGVISGPVTPVIVDDGTGTATNPNEPLPSNDTFDIISSDIKLNQYKEKLKTYSQIAYDNGNVELSKEINNKFEQLLTNDAKLHELPENLQVQPKDLEAASNVKASTNAYFATKSNEFKVLEQDFLSSINEFSKKLPVAEYPQPENVEAANVEISSNSSLNNDEVRLADVNKTPQLKVMSPQIKLNESTRKPELDSLAQANSVDAQATPTLTIVSTTATSITYSVVFPSSGIWGDCIALWDFNNGQTIIPSSPYDGNWYKTSGTYTISGLVPGGIYILGEWWSTDNSYTGWANSILRRVQLPYTTTETLTRTDGTYVFTNIEAADKAYATTSNFNTWISRLDSSYLAIKDLTGYTPYSGNKIELKSSRQDFNIGNPDGQNYWTLTWAWAGNPALFSQPFVRSHMLRLSSNDWGDASIHEISHDFDNYAWEFDSETCADFKEYYAVETLGATVYRNDTNKYYSGSAFYNFFKTDQWYSYDNTFNYGYYSSRGLTAMLIRIKNTIGWQPFKDTFRYFNNLPTGQVPNGNIAKLNLFLTKLRDYSGRDVIGLFSTNEKNIMQTQFGGTIAYYVPPVASPISVNTPIDVNSTTPKIYKFTPTVTGTYTILTSPYAGSGASNDTYLELYSDEALTNLITSNDDGGGNSFSKISLTLTGGTSYYIKLRHYNNTSQIYARIGITLEIPTLSLNSPIDVDLAAGQYMVYKFTPTSSATYNIFTGPYGGTGSSNDTYLELYSDAALTSKITENDDGAGNLFSKINTPLTAGTTYYIKLRPYSSNWTVHARLTITQFVPVLTLNSNVDIQVAQNGYAVYKFIPTETALYQFATSPYAGGTTSSDTYLELYTDEALTNRIAYNDDFGGTLFSNVQVNLNANTTYYLKFKGYNNSASSARIVANKINVASVKMVGITSNSITLKVQYPMSGVNGNELKLFDNTSGQWVSLSGTGSSTTDGIYTINGLTPLTTYQCSLIWYTDAMNSWLKRNIDVNLLTLSLSTYLPLQEMDQATYDELVRQGVRFHTEPTSTITSLGEVSSQWSSGGNNTHRKIAKQATMILKNDKGDFIYNKINKDVWDPIQQKYVNSINDIICFFAYKADEIENDTKAGGIVPTYAGHFYGIDGKNYLGSDKNTAFLRFNNHYWNAITEYRQGIDHVGTAYKELGLAIHYLADLNEPHHVTNRIAYLTWHTDYESWVNDNVDSYLITAAPESSYDYVKDRDFKEMCDGWANLARAQIENADRSFSIGEYSMFDSSTAGIATEDCLSRAQRATAAILYRFLSEVGELQ